MEGWFHKKPIRAPTWPAAFLAAGGILFFAIQVAFATPPGSSYAPGETLDPSCLPGDTNCTVVSFSVSTSTNYFGIGTSTPYAQLSVVGQVVAAYFTATSTSATSTIAGGLLLSGGVRMSALNCNMLTNNGKLTTDASGNVICGDDLSGGTGGGSWSTTTSQVLGRLINNPLNNSDIVAIGANNTTTAKFWFDPNTQIAYVSGKFGIGSSTPSAKFSMEVPVSNTNPIFLISTSTDTSTSTAFIVTDVGKIGVGTSSPFTQLSVAGGVGASSVTTNDLTFANTSVSNNWPTGVIYQSGNRFIHTFAPVGSSGQNTFVGVQAGNFTISTNFVYNGALNTGVGYQSLSSLTTGFRNTAVGNQSLAANTTGGGNVGIGHLSLNANSAGDSNTAVGTQSLYQTTSGSSNVAMGYQTLYSNLTGLSNVALGSLALFYNKSATNTVAIGYNSAVGTANYANQNGVYVGYQAGTKATTGSDGNTFLGYQAGYNVTSGANNIAIGFNADVLSPTGSQQLNIGNVIFGTGIYNGAAVSSAPVTGANIGIGTTSPYATLSVNGAVVAANFVATTTATSTLAGGAVFALSGGNVGIGTSQPSYTLEVYGSASTTNLYIPTTGTTTNNTKFGVIFQAGTPFIHTYSDPTTTGLNTFIGLNAGNFTLTRGGGVGANASFTTGVGEEVLNHLTTAYSSTAVGRQAMFSNTSGSSNAAFGDQAMYTNTIGFNNSAFGTLVMKNNLNGNNNVAVGYEPMFYNTSGFYNVALGSTALFYSITGSENVAVGYQAMMFNSSATSSVAVGSYAGYGVSNTSNQNEVLVGFKSGYSLTSGSNNTFLGYQSGFNVTTGSTNIAIGYNVDLPNNNGTQQLNIGNLIYGTGLYAGVSVSSSTVSGGMVGIGTSSPYATLSVNGAVVAANFVATSTIATSTFGGGLLVATNAGVFGVGTTSPQANLAVSGTGYIGDRLGIGTLPENGYSLKLRDLLNDTIIGVINTNPAYDARLQISNSAGKTTTLETRAANSGLTYAGVSLNNVSILEGSGDNFLVSYDVGSLIFINGLLETMRLNSAGNLSIGTTTASSRLTISATSSLSRMPLFSVLTPTSANMATSAVFMVSSEGQVGVGTSSPYAALAVNGQVVAANFVATSTIATSTFAGRIGIGTSSPSALLAIQGTVTQASTPSPLAVYGPGSGNYTGDIILQTGRGDVGSGDIILNAGWGGMSGATGGNIRIAAGGATSAANGGSVYIDSGSGSYIAGGYLPSAILLATLQTTTNVGIGTSSPYAKLSVNGAVVAANFMATSTTATSTFSGAFSIATATPASRFALVQSSDTAGGGLFISSTGSNSRTMYVDGSGVTHFYGGVNGTWNDATLNAAGAWTNASDITYKQDIVDLGTRYTLGTIMNLKPRYYVMKGINMPQIGFIAQEMKQVIPEVVSGDDGHMGIEYGNLEALSIKGIQDLSVILDIQASGDVGMGTASGTPTFTSVRLDDIEKRIAALEVASSSPSGMSSIMAAVLSYFETLGVKITNGLVYVNDLFAQTITATNVASDTVVAKKICLEDVCITKSDLLHLLQTGGVTSPSSDSGNTSVASTTTVTSSPVITLIGNNPATIDVGTTYTDPGATAVAGDGTSLLPDLYASTVDTSFAGTYEVVWRVHDSAMTWATSTRTVIVQPLVPPIESTTTPETASSTPTL